MSKLDIEESRWPLIFLDFWNFIFITIKLLICYHRCCWRFQIREATTFNKFTRYWVWHKWRPSWVLFTWMPRKNLRSPSSLRGNSTFSCAIVASIISCFEPKRKLYVHKQVNNVIITIKNEQWRICRAFSEFYRKQKFLKPPKPQARRLRPYNALSSRHT